MSGRGWIVGWAALPLLLTAAPCLAAPNQMVSRSGASGHTVAIDRHDLARGDQVQVAVTGCTDQAGGGEGMWVAVAAPSSLEGKGILTMPRRPLGFLPVGSDGTATGTVTMGWTPLYDGPSRPLGEGVIEISTSEVDVEAVDDLTVSCTPTNDPNQFSILDELGRQAWTQHEPVRWHQPHLPDATAKAGSSFELEVPCEMTSDPGGDRLWLSTSDDTPVPRQFELDVELQRPFEVGDHRSASLPDGVEPGTYEIDADCRTGEFSMTAVLKPFTLTVPGPTTTTPPAPASPVESRPAYTG